jgi:ParB family chromosome partitioning protein
MARKNIFDFSPSGDNTPNDTTHPVQSRSDRPLAGLDRDRTTKPAALGAISQSLEKINERSARAEEIERQLASGETIVEIETDLIDASFVSDRLGYDDEDQARLIEQIRDTGQLVPILVRPHPDDAERYQIAYGHRRVAALRHLGRKVRAVVKLLTDEELIVHQGQENNTRSNLSFIEKAMFAAALEEQGFSREVLFQSTGIDKAVLSKMISVVRLIPADIIRRIGRAPSIGRNRWEEVAALIAELPADSTLTAVNTPAFEELSTDDRFQLVFDSLKLSKTKADTRKPPEIAPALRNGVQPVLIKKANRKVQFTFDEKVAPQFAEFIESRLSELYDDFLNQDVSS